MQLARRAMVISQEEDECIQCSASFCSVVDGKKIKIIFLSTKIKNTITCTVQCILPACM